MEDTIRLSPLGKDIEIYVSQRHTFGTDAILLSHFASPRPSERTADLGTGCGIIPFLWCLSAPPEAIDAVEIQPDAAALVRRSVEHNRIGNFLRIFTADLRRLEEVLPASGYDLVTCNPPYRPENTGLKNRDEGRRVARHEEQCTLGDVSAAAARLLRFGGRFCLCQRPERLPDVLEALRSAGLEPKTLRLCAQRPGKKPFLCLVSARKGGRPFLEVQPTLYLEDSSGQRTEEIRQIYGKYGEVPE